MRWELASELAQSDRRVNELVADLREPQNLVSYHLAILKRAGLVTERRSSADARDVYYHLELDRLQTELGRSAATLHPLLGATGAGSMALKRRPRVLFMCTGNSARSLIAEATLRRLAGRDVEVFSAGPRPAGIHPLTTRLLSELGFSTRGLRSKGLHEVAEIEFDYVISLCDIAREECPPRPEQPHQIHWSLADPASVSGSPAARLRAFKRTANEIDLRIRQLLPVLALGGHMQDE